MSEDLPLLIQEAEAILEFHSQWEEAVRTGDQFFNEGQEIQIKNGLSLWLDKNPPEHIKRLALMAAKISDLLANWKTPKLYPLPGMRTQLIRGESVKKFMGFVKEGKAQKERRDNDRT